VLPWRSVIVMMVLLNDAWMCAMPSATTRLIFFLTAFCSSWLGHDPVSSGRLGGPITS
jgi:hypothetical protein